MCWLVGFIHAQEPSTQTPPQDARPAEGSSAKPQSQESQAKGGATGAAAGRGQGFDQATVSAGMAAFERSCTKCHDAARSLERTKDLAGWRATVRRMAAKRDANIASGDIEPIAVYLASRNAAASGASGGAETSGAAGAQGGTEKAGGTAAGADTSSLSTFATISPLWRGGNDHLQNNGFGPLAWVGASWQGQIVSGRVTACISCHGVQEPSQINRIEVAEAAVRVELSKFLDEHCKGMKGNIDAGRFIVPFGAFSAQSDPSLYRTVSTPLIFNMGQRIFNQDLGFPVLPMPYSDEGINLNLSIPICDCCCGKRPITLTTDTYLVNGLEGGSGGLDYLQSRDLLDNNNRVAGGARVTIGDPYIRAGASFTTGRFDVPSDTHGLVYTIYGFDVQARYKRLLRCQFEYARRDSDRIGILANGAELFSEGVYGYYVEAEARPGEQCRVSFLARYDNQRHNSPLPPSGSSLTTGTFNVERMTLGVNIELWHQSLLMFNYERWLVPEPFNRTADVFGVRYTITF
jgi:hypothetical protein